jgi:hypothetical protein
MAISDETIKQLQAAVKTEIITAKGRDFSTRPIHEIPAQTKSQPTPLTVHTLSGFADYVMGAAPDNPDGRLATTIHVVSHREVRLLSPIFGEAAQRDCFAVASFEELFGKSFSFGQLYDHESFVVALQTLFEPTPERDQVLRVIGTIKEETVAEHSDDGVTQAVTARAGLALVKEVPVPNPVNLRPYRTFRDIEQPESLFILRVRRGGDGEKPKCALFEADGGRWKLTAIESIRGYLEAKNLGKTIIA